MTKNPLLNALAAIGYIVFVALIMFYGPGKTGPTNTIFIPIAVVSLFTLSAAVMGFIFFYQPFQLYFDGHKKAALDLFFKTLAIFAGVTFLMLALVFSGILPPR